MAVITNQDPLEPQLDPDHGLLKPQTSQDFLDAPPAAADGQAAPTKPTFDDAEVLAFLGEAKRLSRSYQQMAIMAQWERSQTAYRSQHSSGSKYTKDQYKNRAKYFKPKTRTAVQKNLAATASAMFAGDDVVSINAQDDGNPQEQANAALLKEIINARFNNKTKRAGVPWFQIALGARLDTQIMGIVCSKQTWRYRCRDTEVTAQVEKPFLLPDGSPAMDQTGQPMTQMVDEKQTVRDVLEDKPEIMLIPGEMVLIDQGSNWIDPAQNSPTLIVQWPMHIDDIKSMMRDDEKNMTPWRAVSDTDIAGAYYSEAELLGLKAARDGTSGSAALRSTSKFGGNRNEIAEARENFFRRDGIDYHCWTLKDKTLLSEVVPVEEVYPAHRGTRPYVLGTDTLESHVLYPESHVASWRQPQDEINDFANLRMDATRQAVFPTAKVKAGRGIDYKSVQRRDGQGIILVKDMGDIEWDRPPGVAAGAYQEGNLLNNDFDEQAHVFSNSSVQSNRQLHDTVGGMQIMSANAGSGAEFDLRCYAETWVEPVLSQIIMLEQYYEDDATLLAVSGEKAKLWEKYGVSQITDELLESQVTLTTSIGFGSSDPMQQLAKFKTTFDIAMPVLGMAVKEGRADIQYDAVLNEIFGKAGYRNGASRFIKLSDGKQMSQEQAKGLMDMMQKLKGENDQLKAGQNDKTQAAMISAKSSQSIAETKASSDFITQLLDYAKTIHSTEISAKHDMQGSVLDAVVDGVLAPHIAAMQGGQMAQPSPAAPSPSPGGASPPMGGPPGGGPDPQAAMVMQRLMAAMAGPRGAPPMGAQPSPGGPPPAQPAMMPQLTGPQ